MAPAAAEALNFRKIASIRAEHVSHPAHAARGRRSIASGASKSNYPSSIFRPLRASPAGPEFSRGPAAGGSAPAGEFRPNRNRPRRSLIPLTRRERPLPPQRLLGELFSRLREIAPALLLRNRSAAAILSGLATERPLSINCPASRRFSRSGKEEI